MIESGRAVSHSVEPGATRGNDVEIRGGLEGGESVVLDPPAKLRNGARVRAIAG